MTYYNIDEYGRFVAKTGLPINQEEEVLCVNFSKLDLSKICSFYINEKGELELL